MQLFVYTHAHSLTHSHVYVVATDLIIITDRERRQTLQAALKIRLYLTCAKCDADSLKHLHTK